MSFANQVVVITGASSGIGWALARELAKAGARVGLVARRRENLERLAEDIRAAGGVAAYAPADVADREQTNAAIRSVREQLGPVDVLVANAGFGKPTLLDQSNIDEVEMMFRVNVLGVIYSIEAVLPEMLQRRRGHLAAMSSLGGYKGMPGESGYCATKSAVNTYMEGLRIQLRPHGIVVTTICPGFIRTPMTESFDFAMPFAMDADTAARRIARALRRRVKVYNFPWQTTLLMKLTRFLPDWLVLRQVGPYTGKIENRSDKAAKQAPAEASGSA